MGVCVVVAGLLFGVLPVSAEEAAPARTTVSGQLNINTATQQELAMLPGIGMKTAANIISYRQEHGPFATVDELQNVNGVGKKTLDKFRNNCTVKGDSTLVTQTN
jgi:competence protein ComEA